MDPLVYLLPELQDCIFNQFDVPDFREVTKVSPTWNEVLGKSVVMMKKVKFAFDQKPHNPRGPYEINLDIRLSTRRYRYACWNSTAFSHHVLQFLVTMSPTLVELEIDCNVDISSEENENFFKNIDLSRLKVLKVKMVFGNMVNNLLMKCNSLATLRLHGYILKDDHPPIPSWRPFLERNRSLEKIEIIGGSCKPFFEDDNSDVVRFNLKTLKIWTVERVISVSDDAIDRNMKKFFETQSKSLEKLSISACTSDGFEYIFNNMTALKYLRVFNDFNADAMKLNVNENIVKLCIYDINRPVDFRKIIRAVPKLTKLTTKELTPEKIEIISRDLLSLQTIKFQSGESLMPSLWPNVTPTECGQNSFDCFLLTADKPDALNNASRRA